MTRCDRADRQILQGHDDGGKTKNRLLVCDDLFARELQLATFDLGHGPFRLAPLQRSGQLLAGYWRLCEPGGTLGLRGTLMRLDPTSVGGGASDRADPRRPPRSRRPP